MVQRAKAFSEENTKFICIYTEELEKVCKYSSCIMYFLSHLLCLLSSHREGGGSDKVSRIHITDQLTDKKNLFLVSNAVQLTALVVDSMINQTGGIKMLLAECCHLPIAKKRQLPMLEVSLFFTCFDSVLSFIFRTVMILQQAVY